MKKLEILYEDEFCLMINKPAGLAVQGGKGVTASLDKILADTARQKNAPAPLLVHRLDKDTSGVILTAKTKEAAGRFSRIFANDRAAGDCVKKQYTAVCAGHPAKSEGTITLDLMVRDKLKKSKTRYKVIKTGKLTAPETAQENMEFSVLELELGTGRMHQIRRHLAMCKTPILGDDKYGDFALNKNLRKSMGLNRLLLHASRLVITGEFALNIHSPLPEYFKPYL